MRETESSLQVVNALPSINWLNKHPLAKMYCYSVVPEIEKPRGISVWLLGKRVLTQPLMSDRKEGNSKWPVADVETYLNPYLLMYFICCLSTVLPHFIPSHQPQTMVHA